MTSHLRDYLSYYKKLEEPGYAVLVTGAWGAGKTYQVKKTLEKGEYYYISLFGLDTVEAVHADVIAAVNPSSGSYAKGLGSVVEDAGYKGVGSLIPSFLNAIIRRNLDIDRILIFDDLERSNIVPKDLQGIINSYVEHRGCRVIVIAHDNEVITEFTKTKEKIIGQTIEIEPELKQAYESFTKEGTNNPLVRYTEDILNIFNVSRVGSLRILKHVIQDLGRLYSVLKELDQKYLKHEKATEELVRLFVALDLEIRAGNISKEAILNRNEDILSLSGANLTDAAYAKKYRSTGHKINFNSIEQDKKSVLMKTDEKFNSVSLYSFLLSDEIIIKMLFGGLYQNKMLSKTLNDYPYFVELSTPKEKPPWMTVIRFDVLEDGIVDKAIQEMDDQYQNRTVTVSGEMLHIFSLRMMLSEQGVIPDSFDEVEEGAKKYIDDLLEGGRLPPKELKDPDYFYKFETGYKGQAYWIGEKYLSQFKSIFSHLLDAREAALKENFESFSGDLLEWLKSDTKKFYETLCHSGDYTGYEELPILRSIDTETFVKTWLSAPRENWMLVTETLKKRYRIKKLVEEWGWIESVRGLLENKANDLEGLERFRMQRILPDLTREE